MTAWVGLCLVLAVTGMAIGPKASAGETVNTMANIVIDVQSGGVDEQTLHYDFDVTLMSFPFVDSQCAAGSCWLAVRTASGKFIPNGYVHVTLGETVNFSGSLDLPDPGLTAEQSSQLTVQALLDVGTDPATVQYRSQFEVVDFAVDHVAPRVSFSTLESFVVDGDYFYDVRGTVSSLADSEGDVCGNQGWGTGYSPACMIEIQAIEPNGTRHLIASDFVVYPGDGDSFYFDSVVYSPFSSVHLSGYAPGTIVAFVAHGYLQKRSPYGWYYGDIVDDRYLTLAVLYGESQGVPPGLGFGGEPVTDLPGWLESWDPPSETRLPWSERSYFALGDSFQAGEGTHHYLPNTDESGINMCHRSVDAYPGLLTDRDFFDGLDLEFWACSGAQMWGMRTRDVTHYYGGAWNDPWLESWDSAATPGAQTQSALDRLDENTAVVTVGIGGNDLGLPETLQKCVIASVTKTVTLPGTYYDPAQSCESVFGNEINVEIGKLGAEHKWVNLFDAVAEQAPNARIYVFGYPRLFEQGGTFVFPCQGLRPSDQVWANATIEFTNKIIEASVRASDAPHIQYIDIYDVGNEKELCSSLNPSSWFVNDLNFDPYGNEDPLLRVEESFHPNSLGHVLIAGSFEAQAVEPVSGWIGSIREGETLRSTFTVTGTTELQTSVVYRGSNVEVTLISPSGVRYSGSSGQPNVEGDHGPTWDSVAITNPEPGEWEVELFGAEIDASGEPFDFEWYEVPAPNQAPVASATVVQHGATVTVTSTSTDEDGMLVETAFDFGDGTVVYGDSATHTYTDGGSALIKMWVKDDGGAYDFAQVGDVIELPNYQFEGFHAPGGDTVESLTSRAGTPMLLRFGLGGAWGTDVFAAGSPTVQEVACDAGSPQGEPRAAVPVGNTDLRYVRGLGEYLWHWDTDPSWSGTCQALTYEFNDGDVARLVVDFS